MFTQYFDVIDSLLYYKGMPQPLMYSSENEKNEMNNELEQDSEETEEGENDIFHECNDILQKQYKDTGKKHMILNINIR